MSGLPFASSTNDQGINEPLLREYAFFLANKAEGTIEAYLRQGVKQKAALPI